MLSWFAASAAVLLGFVGGSAVCQAAHGAGRLSPWMRTLHLSLASATGLLFLSTYLTRGLSVDLLGIWLFVMALVAVSVLDVEQFLLPVRALVLGAGVAVFLAPQVTGSPWWMHFGAALVTAAILHMLSRVPQTGVEPPAGEFGLFAGAVLGQLVVVSLLAALAVRALAGVTLPRLSAGPEVGTIPFAPYLAAGSALAVLGI